MRGTNRNLWPKATLALSMLLLAPTLAGADGRRMEEIARGWVEAHNSGSVEVMRTFRQKHREAGGEGWEEQFDRLVERLGRLEVEEVTIDGSGELVFGAVSAVGGLRLTFEFSSEDPERIRGISIDRGRRRENSLPELSLEAGDWSSRAQRIDAYIAGLAADDQFAGTVWIAEGDTVVFQGAWGLASREFSVPNTLETRFDIGSITKDFTRVSIAQLVGSGKLGIDDTLGQHLPDYPNAEAREKVTVRHLFEHTSGIGDYFTDEWSRTPMGALRDHSDYIEIWGPKPLEFEPGSRQSYSNFGFTLLGAIIERVSGRSYFDYVADEIFAPAGMTRSGFFETDAVVADVAVGYTWMQRNGERGSELRKNIYLEPAKGGPWGKTYCTVGDLGRFWQAVRHHRLNPPALTDWVLLNGPPPADGKEQVTDPSPVTEVGLGGGGPGLSAELWAGEGRTIIVLSNLDPPSATDLARRLREALD